MQFYSFDKVYVWAEGAYTSKIPDARFSSLLLVGLSQEGAYTSKTPDAQVC